MARQLRLFVFPQSARSFDVRHDPGSFHRSREPSRVANKFFCKRAAAHRHKKPIATFPRPGNLLLLHQLAQIAIDMFRNQAQRHSRNAVR